MSVGRAYDVLMMARHDYYVVGASRWSDLEYDALEREAMERWPWLVDVLKVGSDNGTNYALYIRDGRRPNGSERETRDRELDRAALGELW